MTQHEKCCPKLFRSWHITVSNDTIVVLAKFKVQGTARFLSHAETVEVFRRACVRADIKMVYSMGFNPRPRLSLPLPRSVGVETDCDLMCLKVQSSAGLFDAKRFKTKLNEQLPEGFELIDVSVVQTKPAFEAGLAVYELVLRADCVNEDLRTRIEKLLASPHLETARSDGKGNFRNLDLRGFLKSIELRDRRISVKCRTGSGGSIRVDEILKLLALAQENLDGPIRRTKVQWLSN